MSHAGPSHVRFLQLSVVGNLRHSPRSGPRTTAQRNHGTGRTGMASHRRQPGSCWIGAPRPGRDNYLRDASYIDAYCQVHAKYLEQNKPASVLEVAPKMVRPDFLVEVYAVAKKRRAVRRETYVRTLNQIGALVPVPDRSPSTSSSAECRPEPSDTAVVPAPCHMRSRGMEQSHSR
jgi:hypothetical protein